MPNLCCSHAVTMSTSRFNPNNYADLWRAVIYSKGMLAPRTYGFWISGCSSLWMESLISKTLTKPPWSIKMLWTTAQISRRRSRGSMCSGYHMRTRMNMSWKLMAQEWISRINGRGKGKQASQRILSCFTVHHILDLLQSQNISVSESGREWGKQGIRLCRGTWCQWC